MSVAQSSASASNPKFCSQCAAPLRSGSQFCHVCGAGISTTSSPSVSPTAAASNNTVLPAQATASSTVILPPNASPTVQHSNATRVHPHIGKKMLWGVGALALLLAGLLFADYIYVHYTPAGATWQLTHRTPSEEELRHILDRGADTNAITDMGTPVLIKYAAFAHSEEMTLLLDHGANSKGKDGQGNTPLHQAARFGNIKVFPVLCAKGSDVNAANSDGETPLSYLIVHQYDILKSIALGKGRNVGPFDSFDATDEADYEQGVQTLLSYGANLNDPAQSGQGMTALHLAAQQRSSEGASLVKMFLDQGINVNARNANGDTPLLLAVQQGGNTETVKLLLERRANVRVQNKQGQTPLYFAQHFGYEDYIQWFRKAGATK